MAKRRLKRVKPSRGRFTRVIENNAPHPNRQTPLVSFRHVLPQYCASECETNEMRSLFRKLRSWSTMSWQQLIQAPREGLGLETIADESLRRPAPRITPDQRVLSLRVHGIVRMLGCRDGQTLHVFAFDRNGDWYDHD